MTIPRTVATATVAQTNHEPGAQATPDAAAPSAAASRTYHSLTSPVHGKNPSFVSVDTGRTLRRTDAFEMVDGKAVTRRADAAQPSPQEPAKPSK